MTKKTKLNKACKSYIAGFIGKDGDTYLLSEIDAEKDIVVLKNLQKNKFVTITIEQWYLYEKKGLLKRFEYPLFQH